MIQKQRSATINLLKIHTQKALNENHKLMSKSVMPTHCEPIHLLGITYNKFDSSIKPTETGLYDNPLFNIFLVDNATWRKLLNEDHPLVKLQNELQKKHIILHKKNDWELGGEIKINLSI